MRALAGFKNMHTTVFQRGISQSNTSQSADQGFSRGHGDFAFAHISLIGMKELKTHINKIKPNKKFISNRGKEWETLSVLYDSFLPCCIVHHVRE